MSTLTYKPRPFFQIPTGGIDMPLLRQHQELEKVVVVMGATGTGKSRLAVDLATRFSSEIINSDKMQMYKGLDILTNKITHEESQGVPHHLMSIIDPTADFTAASFCNLATDITKSVSKRGKLPIIAGGSNSFVEALIDDNNSKFRSRFQCCFLWVDVSIPVLHSFVSERVDRMIERGMINEMAKMFSPNADYSKGIRRSIGVPEFDGYFRAITNSEIPDDEVLRRLLEEGINEVKSNTCKLACKQRDKINQLRTVKGWKIHRLDATTAFRRSGDEADKAWEDLVVGPSSMIVRQFLNNYNYGATTAYHETASAIGGGRRMRVAAMH